MTPAVKRNRELRRDSEMGGQEIAEHGRCVVGALLYSISVIEDVLIDVYQPAPCFSALATACITLVDTPAQRNARRTSILLHTTFSHPYRVNVAIERMQCEHKLTVNCTSKTSSQSTSPVRPSIHRLRVPPSPADHSGVLIPCCIHVRADPLHPSLHREER